MKKPSVALHRPARTRVRTDSVFELLRVHPEPFAYIDERAVHNALTSNPLHYLEFVDRMLTRIATGRALVTLPSKLIFTDAGSSGDFRVMPCVLRDGGTVVKTVKVVGTNIVQKRVPDQVTVGKALCLDPEENFVTHVIEACLLSSARTGVCAAVAIRRLASRRQRVTIIGAGRVGYYAALYASALGGVKEIVISDTRPERATSLASVTKGFSQRRVRVGTMPIEDRIATDVLVLATTSTTPLCRPNAVSASLIVSTGADTQGQRELSPEWAPLADVYVDSLDSARVGDLRAWLATGSMAKGDLVDLMSLCRDGPRPAGKRTRIFISTGSALFDNLTIAYLLRHARGAKASS